MRPDNDTSTKRWYKPGYVRTREYKKFIEDNLIQKAKLDKRNNMYYVIHRCDKAGVNRVICLTKAQVPIHDAIMRSVTMQTTGRLDMVIVRECLPERSVNAMIRKGFFRKTEKYLYPL